MWVVFATRPKAGWSFAPDYFPRKVKLKADATARAKEAKNAGGLNVYIEKSNDVGPMPEGHMVVRCERDRQIFTTPPDVKVINCPTCFRGYSKEESGKWEADRPLTILHDPSNI